MEQEQFANLDPDELIMIEGFDVPPTEKRLIYGDVEGIPVFEASLEDDDLDPFVNQVILKGGRVIYTDKGLKLIIHSEDSLKFHKVYYANLLKLSGIVF